MTRNMIRVPDPQFYRQKKHSSRKLNKAEKKSQNQYYMVPRFFDLYHPTTVWLINVIRSENERELNRVLMDKDSKSLLKFEPDPRAIQSKKTVIGGKREFIISKAKYFQILDRPDFYSNKESRSSLFNRHAVMYLTPLGLAIYMRKPKAARILVQCVDRDTNRKHIQARQPQFITFMNERFGDLMCMYDHNLAILTETYDILELMLQNDNWFPMEPHMLVYRKRSVETYLHFDDFMDYAFYVMFTKRSSLNIPGLCQALLKCPSEHFRFTYMCQPSRANKLTLLRDSDRIINNCKSYPRRLLRCAFYADKKLKSTVNLVRAAGLFINMGIFKLVGDSFLPFVSKPTRRKRLETMPVYRERSRAIRVEWPTAHYEFDADCCIALLIGILAKCYRLGKMPTFAVTIRMAVKVLADAGWLNHFDIISDLEFKDYFMGLDDAEKVRFQPEVFCFVRECARITVIDQSHELARFFSEERLDRELRALNDVRDQAVLTRMLMCNDENITRYVIMEKGEELKGAGTVIGGKRARGVGRDNPKNKYYMDRLEFPRESVKTVMTNTANTEDSSGGGGGATTSSDDDGTGVGFFRPGNRSNDVDSSSDDMSRQDVREFLVDAEIVRDRPSLRGRPRLPQKEQEQQHQEELQQLPRRLKDVRGRRPGSAGTLSSSLLPVPTRARGGAAPAVVNRRPRQLPSTEAAAAPAQANQKSERQQKRKETSRQ